MQLNMRKMVPPVKVTEAVVAQTYMGVLFNRSVSDTIFAMPFFSETACRLPGEHLRTTL
jgi:hypothetical protein